MSENENTLIALKSSFLRTQIRILSQPLQPSQRWRNQSQNDGQLTDSAIADATRKANRQLRRHTKMVFSSPAVRHVAEQIDRLYWNAAAPDLDPGDFEDPDDGILRVDDDLTLPNVIENLADTWEFDSDTTLSAKQRMDRDAYEEACARLKALAEQRHQAEQKLRALNEVRAMLQPFENPRETVQHNLVTRDGRLADELGRCKELSVRVGARLGAMDGKENNPYVDSDSDRSAFTAKERLRMAWDAT